MILNQLKIRGLYDLYDYDLDFANHQNPNVRFITAPNGYGKSTILRLIEAFFSRSLNLFVNPKLHYNIIEFVLAKYRVEFTQKRYVNQNVNSDDDDDFVEATIAVFKTKGKTPIETKTISSEDVKANSDELLPGTINIYLKSIKPHLVADNRLWVKEENNEEHISKLSKIVGNAIEEIDSSILKSVNKSVFLYTTNQLKADENLEKLCTKTRKLLTRYHKVGIAKEISESMLDKDNPLRVSYIYALSDSLDNNDPKLRKLEQLIDWVEKCEFANKKMILRKEDGLVFEANDKDKSKILPEELSSGEKQIVVQLVELLFCTQQVLIVLIDEPELSYHVAWQMIYYEQIKKIAKQCKLQCIIATHNPQMFNYDWDSSIDLFTQHNLIHQQQQR